MNQKSLGLIETYGLVAAVEAADAAVKSANVELVGYEFAKGSGMTTIKVEGDVGAVNAAVAAAQIAAAKVGSVASVRVIARPSAGLERMVRNAETKGYSKLEPPKPEQEPPKPEPPKPAPEPPKLAPIAPKIEPVKPLVKEAVPETKAAIKAEPSKPVNILAKPEASKVAEKPGQPQKPAGKFDPKHPPKFGDKKK